MYEIDIKQINSSFDNLTQLQQSNWIDKRTRAIIIQINLYNPNANLFAYCTILFEMLPTGTILKYTVFNKFKLYYENSFFIIFDIVYIAIITFFLLKEIRKIRKIGFKV